MDEFGAILAGVCGLMADHLVAAVDSEQRLVHAEPGDKEAARRR